MSNTSIKTINSLETDHFLLILYSLRHQAQSLLEPEPKQNRIFTVERMDGLNIVALRGLQSNQETKTLYLHLKKITYNTSLYGLSAKGL